MPKSNTCNHKGFSRSIAGNKIEENCQCFLKITTGKHNRYIPNCAWSEELMGLMGVRNLSEGTPNTVRKLVKHFGEEDKHGKV